MDSMRVCSGCGTQAAAAESPVRMMCCLGPVCDICAIRISSGDISSIPHCASCEQRGEAIFNLNHLTGSPKNCAACPMERSVAKCQECDEDLCAQCVEAHQRNGCKLQVKLTRDHQLSAHPTSNTCPSHGYPWAFFCVTCRALGCAYCFQTGHANHKCEPHDHFSARIKKGLDERMAQLTQKAYYLDSTRQAVGEQSDSLQSKADAWKEAVKSAEVKLRALLENRCAALDEEIDESVNEFLKRTKNMENNMRNLCYRTVQIDAVKYALDKAVAEGRLRPSAVSSVRQQLSSLESNLERKLTAVQSCSIRNPKEFGVSSEAVCQALEKVTFRKPRAGERPCTSRKPAASAPGTSVSVDFASSPLVGAEQLPVSGTKSGDKHPASSHPHSLQRGFTSFPTVQSYNKPPSVPTRGRPRGRPVGSGLASRGSRPPTVSQLVGSQQGLPIAGRALDAPSGAEHSIRGRPKAPRGPRRARNSIIQAPPEHGIRDILKSTGAWAQKASPSSGSGASTPVYGASLRAAMAARQYSYDEDVSPSTIVRSPPAEKPVPSAGPANSPISATQGDAPASKPVAADSAAEDESDFFVNLFSEETQGSSKADRAEKKDQHLSMPDLVGAGSSSTEDDLAATTAAFEADMKQRRKEQKRKARLDQNSKVEPLHMSLSGPSSSTATDERKANDSFLTDDLSGRDFVELNGTTVDEKEVAIERFDTQQEPVVNKPPNPVLESGTSEKDEAKVAAIASLKRLHVEDVDLATLELQRPCGSSSPTGCRDEPTATPSPLLSEDEVHQIMSLSSHGHADSPSPEIFSVQERPGQSAAVSAKQHSVSGKGRMTPEVPAEQVWEDWCSVCHDGGDMVCCDRCPRVFHVDCHIPGYASLDAVADDWHCLFCDNVQPCDNSPDSRAGFMGPHFLQICNRILLGILCDDNAAGFEKPVSEDDAPDYSKVISHPMDLGTIKKSLSEGRYSFVGEFLEDVNQVFINMATYNARECEIFVAGCALWHEFKSLVNLYLPTFSRQVVTRLDLERLADTAISDSEMQDEPAGEPVASTSSRGLASRRGRPQKKRQSWQEDGESEWILGEMIDVLIAGGTRKRRRKKA